LTFEDDELLTQQGVFQDQFRLGTVQVQSCIEGRGTIVRLCPQAKGRLEDLPERTEASLDEGEEKGHGLPFSQESEAVILPHNRLNGQNPRTDGVFCHDSRADGSVE
jgi:hypothetical protein